MRFVRIEHLVLVLVLVCLSACVANGEPTSSTTAALFHGPGVEDVIGTVSEWEFAEDIDSWTDLPEDFEWGMRQIDPRAIEIGWWGLGCDDDPRLVVDAEVIQLTLDGYLGDRPDPEVGCAMMGIWREFRLTFDEPIDADAITLTVIEPPS